MARSSGGAGASPGGAGERCRDGLRQVWRTTPGRTTRQRRARERLPRRHGCILRKPVRQEPSPRPGCAAPCSCQAAAGPRLAELETRKVGGVEARQEQDRGGMRGPCALKSPLALPLRNAYTQVSPGEFFLPELRVMRLERLVPGTGEETVLATRESAPVLRGVAAPPGYTLCARRPPAGSPGTESALIPQASCHGRCADRTAGSSPSLPRRGTEPHPGPGRREA